MGLDTLSNSLKDAMKKLAGKTVIDRAAVDELVRDLQRALLSSDVNVKLVMELSKQIKARSLDEDLPKGINAREHVLRIVYQELVNLVGKEAEFSLKPQKILMAGLQGSGKTTTTGKLCRYFQRKGLKVGAIGADNFRPGAYAQLETLCKKINVPSYGDPKEKDAVKIVKDGLAALKDVDVIIVDTAGRHALEDDLTVLGTPHIKLQTKTDKDIYQLNFFIYEVDKKGVAKMVIHQPYSGWRSTPDKLNNVDIQMNILSHRFKAGNKIRLVVTTSDIVYVLPALKNFNADLFWGGNTDTKLELPIL